MIFKKKKKSSYSDVVSTFELPLSLELLLDESSTVVSTLELSLDDESLEVLLDGVDESLECEVDLDESSVVVSTCEESSEESSLE